MNSLFFRKPVRAALTLLAMTLAGCAIHKDQDVASTAGRTGPEQCQPAPAGDGAIGNWYGVRSQRGVVGELIVLVHLKADGAMSYQEQLKRSGKPSQTLSEAGCWHRDQQALVLQTTRSNGEPVELADPIYRNRYAVRSQSAQSLVLDGPGGLLKARRMPDGYRLPVF